MNGPVETSSNEACEARLADQELAREHDRLRTLFDITNAVVSKLGREELLSAISEQLSNIIRHDDALLSVCSQTGGLEVFALLVARDYVALGMKSACLVPLTARDRTIGALDLGRMTDDAWTPDDVEFLVPAALLGP